MKMSAIFAGIILTMVFLVYPAFSSQRMVVAEFFTNTYSNTDVPAVLLMDSLATQYDSNLALIRYHVNWPDPMDPFYRFNMSENMARNNYYSSNYVPHLFIDGDIDAGYQYAGYRTRLSWEFLADSPLNIYLTGIFNEDIGTGQLEIAIAAEGIPSQDSLHLRAAITETGLHYNAPNGITIHNQVFRDLLPSIDGIPITLVQGDSLNFQLNFEVQDPINTDSVSLIVFVQSDRNRHILQGCKIRLNELRIIHFPAPFQVYHPVLGEYQVDYYTNFIWGQSFGTDSISQISYFLQVSQDTGFSELIFSSDGLTDTSLAIPTDSLYGYGLFYWRISARDEFGFSTLGGIPPGIQYFHVLKPGDVNHDDSINGIDVVFMVNCIKGYGPLPDPFLAGDINADCEFNSLDIIYFVNFLKGYPEPFGRGQCQ